MQRVVCNLLKEFNKKKNHTKTERAWYAGHEQDLENRAARPFPTRSGTNVRAIRHTLTAVNMPLTMTMKAGVSSFTSSFLPFSVCFFFAILFCHVKGHSLRSRGV